MKKVKQFLSVLLALIMVLSTFPMTAFAADNIINSGWCGENVTWVFDKSTGTLTISGTGDMYDYTNQVDDEPWWRETGLVSNIKTLILEEGVTSIGDGTFKEATEMTNVVLPESLTSIGKCSFQQCTSLTEVVLPESLTSIDEYSFAGCTNLEKVAVGDTDIAIGKYVSEIGENAFGGCTKLKSLNVHSDNQYFSNDEKGVVFNKNKTTLVYYPCGKAGTSYTIPDTVTTIGAGAFGGVSDITNITIPAGVTTIEQYALHKCPELEYLYFLGTPEQWDSITLDSRNDDILVYFDKAGVCGENCTWFYDKDTATLTLSGAGVVVESPWDKYGYDIQTIIVDDGVLEITDYLFEENNSIQSVTFGNDVIAVGPFVFYLCENLKTVTFGNSVEFIGQSSFALTALESVYIPASVETIDLTAFVSEHLETITVDENNQCYSSDEGVLFNKNKTTLVQYPAGKTATGYVIPESVTTIGYGAFAYNDNITSITIPLTVTTIEDYIVEECPNFTDVYYEGTEEQWASITKGEENEPLLNATIHFIDTYNMGEESYSFDNFSDSDSSGHCFGMSITSAGYHTSALDITDVGGNTKDDVYALSLDSTVKEPICHYQAIQGSFSLYATVAGGSVYKGNPADIESDWNEVINYVKNHEYDNKGTLQIGFRKTSQGGHAINFLRYEVVDGQERIYAYDNNFPGQETYFYMNSSGKVYQAPRSTFIGNIDCICLRDTNKYFEKAGTYDVTRYIYADSDSILVVGAAEYKMECGNGEYTMYEIPEGATEVEIIPLTDNATFRYNSQEFSFGEVTENTVGKLAIATGEDGTTTPSDFTVTEKTPEASITISNPSIYEIKNRNGIILHTIVENAPDKSYVRWEISNGNFEKEEIADGKLKIIAKNKGWTTFTAVLCTEDGKELARSNSIEMYSKSGFFDKIAGFFANLFGLTDILDK